MRLRAGRSSDTAVVVLAGGKGSRFWPRSRPDRPKQFLALSPGAETLLQATCRRARMIADGTPVRAVLPGIYRGPACEQVPALTDHLILEPASRDTAAAIAVAAWSVAAEAGPDTVVVFLPADHYVPDEAAFAREVRRTVHEARRGGIWVLGLRAVRPEPAYGYIVPREAAARTSRVAAFVEKPDPTRARALVGSAALWNVGNVVARVDALTAALRTCAPAIAFAAEEAVSGHATAYEQLSPLSFDYAVLERSPEVYVARAAFPWDDVGTWTSLDRVVAPDAQGNIVSGPVVHQEVERTILVNDDSERDLVALGLSDVVCVVGDQGVLVASKRAIAGLKSVQAALPVRAPRMGTVPLPSDARVVDKPWGREVWWAESEGYVAKVLEVRAGQSLSLQYHERKHETALVFAGDGVAVLGDDYLELAPGVRLEVPPGTVHRFSAGDDGLVLLEVSTPEVEDVVRIEDSYGRADVPLVGGVAR